MHRKIAEGAVLLSLVLILAACSGQAATAGSKPSSTTPPTQPIAGDTIPATTPSQTVSTSAPAVNQTPKPAGPLKATEITPSITGDTVSIPLNAVQNSWNTHFLVNANGGSMGFMAYKLDNEINVRASVCPPCRGKTYSLDGNVLVCDTCATTFNAKTGIGIAGACVNYPKASVQYTIADGNLLMKMSDLTTAYQNTLKPGLP